MKEKTKPLTEEEWRGLIVYAGKLRKISNLINSIPDRVWKGIHKVKKKGDDSVILIEGSKRKGMSSQGIEIQEYIENEGRFERRQCKGICGSGKRCMANSVVGDYCTTHWWIIKKKENQNVK